MSRTACWLLIATLVLGSTVRAADDEPRPERRRPTAQVLRDVISPVQLQNAPAELAFNWWSQTTGIPLVVDWPTLEEMSIYRRSEVNIDLEAAPAGQVLALIMEQITVEPTTLLYEMTPWYIRVTTKDKANQRTVIKVYDINDLVMEVPNFRARRISLSQSLSNTSSGSSRADSGSQSIFEDDDEDDDRQALRTNRQDRGESIAQLIRDTIEPEIWRENGGNYATCRYWKGRLIVSAPEYVHAQIGIPVVSRRPVTVQREYFETRHAGRPTEADSIGGIQPPPAKPVGGVNEY